jgi:HEPN domain-containing protein
MPKARAIPGTPQDWLIRAKSDLAFALLPLPESAFYEELCFHAQQAAEKALKSVYQHRGWTFRYTHDSEELVTGLKRQNLEVPPEIDDAIVLTSFAWEARYPGLAEPITPEDYAEAVRHAQAVVAWAEKEIGQ